MQQDKISDLPEKTTPVSGDLIEIESPSDSSSKHVTLENLPKGFAANTIEPTALKNGVASGQLVEAFFRGRQQDDTTNSTKTGLTVQWGWGHISPGSSASGADDTVTFAAAFTSAPFVIISSLGLKNTAGAPTSISDFNAYKQKQQIHGHGITATGMSVRAQTIDGTNWGANEFAGYSWIAIGTV